MNPKKLPKMFFCTFLEASFKIQNFFQKVSEKFSPLSYKFSKIEKKSLKLSKMSQNIIVNFSKILPKIQVPTSKVSCVYLTNFFFSDISERNNDYSDTLDFKREWVGEVAVVTFFVLEVPDFKSAMLIWVILKKSPKSCYWCRESHTLHILRFSFFCPVEGGLPILFSYKYGPLPPFFY